VAPSCSSSPNPSHREGPASSAGGRGQLRSVWPSAPPSSRALPSGCSGAWLHLLEPATCCGNWNNSSSAWQSGPPASAPAGHAAAAATGCCNCPWRCSVAATDPTRGAPPWPRSWPVAGVLDLRGRRQQRSHPWNLCQGNGRDRSGPGNGEVDAKQKNRKTAGPSRCCRAAASRIEAELRLLPPLAQPTTENLLLAGLAGSRLRETGGPPVPFLLWLWGPPPGWGHRSRARWGCRNRLAMASTAIHPAPSAPPEGVCRRSRAGAGQAPAAVISGGRQLPSHSQAEAPCLPCRGSARAPPRLLMALRANSITLLQRLPQEAAAWRRAAASLGCNSSPSCAATPCRQMAGPTCSCPSKRALLAGRRHPSAARADLLLNDPELPPCLRLLAALPQRPAPAGWRTAACPWTSPRALLHLELS